MLHHLCRLPMAAALLLAFALPTRGARADHIPSSLASFGTQDGPPRILAQDPKWPPRSRAGMVRWACKKVWKAFGSKNVNDTTQETFTRGMAAVAEGRAPQEAMAELVAKAESYCPKGLSASAREDWTWFFVLGALCTMSLGAAAHWALGQLRESRRNEAPVPADAEATAAVDGTPPTPTSVACETGKQGEDPAVGPLPGSDVGIGEHGVLIRWLRGIRRNVIREHWRKAKKLQTVAPDEAGRVVAATAPSPVASVIAREAEERCNALLEGLRPLEREVVRRHHWDGETFPEIAAHLHITVAAATKCWQRALKRMSSDPRWQRLAEA